mgnify:CR=1 FL=1
MFTALCASCFNPGGTSSSGTSGGPDDPTTGDAPTSTTASSASSTTTASTTAAETGTTDPRPTTGCASDCATTGASLDDTGGSSDDVTTADPADPVKLEAKVMLAGASALVAGPFDPDPRTDLFVTSVAGTLTLFRGGSLMTAEYGVMNPAAALVAINFATMSPDMDDDLVLAAYNMNLTSYRIDDGAPQFASQIGALCGDPYLALGAVVSDSIPDVVLVCPGTTSINIFAGGFDGSFNSPAVFPIDGPAAGLAVANIVGSTRADVLIPTGDDLLVYRNTDIDMAPILLDPLDQHSLPGASHAAAERPKGAEFYDALALQPPVDCAYFASSPNNVPAPLEFQCGKNLTTGGLADLDDDGDLDVVTTSQGNGAGIIDLWLRDNDGFTLLASLPIGDAPRRLAFADLVGDDRIDIAVITEDAVEVFRNELP